MEYLFIYLCHLWFLSLVSYKLSVYSSFVSLGKFIPRYLIIFVAIVNGFNSLISLSYFSLLVNRNASNFYVLILSPATLLNSLISSSNFFLCTVSCHLKTVESFTSSFLIQNPFISFSSLIAVARTSRTGSLRR